MRWKLTNLATAVSLVVCLATAALWVFAQYRGITFSRWGTTRAFFHCSAATGGIVLQGPPFRAAVTPGWQLTISNTPSIMRDAIGGAYWTMRGPNGPGDYVAQIPYWFILLTSSLALIYAYRRSASGRNAAGLCPTCGYDLRASPERCPERGAAAGGSGA